MQLSVSCESTFISRLFGKQVVWWFFFNFTYFCESICTKILNINKCLTFSLRNSNFVGLPKILVKTSSCFWSRTMKLKKKNKIKIEYWQRQFKERRRKHFPFFRKFCTSPWLFLERYSLSLNKKQWDFDCQLLRKLLQPWRLMLNYHDVLSTQTFRLAKLPPSKQIEA